jgi:glutamate decarboxylase
MEPEAREVIARNLHRNFIDHAEYPRTAEIADRCLRILHHLFHGRVDPDAPGTACAGSSEAAARRADGPHRPRLLNQPFRG